MRKTPVVFIVFLFLARILPAQTCLNAGQTPSSPILLCGSESYIQPIVPICGQTNIPAPCPNTATYQNTNPIWFQMNCFSSGTLGFTITPDDLNDNYDWQLFDISGRNNEDVFTDPTLFLACNWCGDPGETGASVDGSNLAVCSGTTQELFSKMPDIIQGHQYLLMVSHRNASESGFGIVVSGGSAGITDPLEPDLARARLSCNSTQIAVYLNKEMNCSTIAPDGSDFILSSGATITSATASCSNGQAGLITLSLSNFVPAGTYTLSIKNGIDGNTIKDKCNREIPAGNSIAVTIQNNIPTSMDSLTTPGCSPDVLQLVFQRPIQCNSIALDGSDFSLSGPQSISINTVTISCNTPTVTTTAITLRLSSPLITSGTYHISLVTGTDGNTLIDECGGPVLPSSITFSVKPSVSAAFTYVTGTSCKQDTVYFSHNGSGVTNWDWSFDNVPGTNSPTQVKIFPAAGQHTARLIVSNGSCKDTVSKDLTLNKGIIAAFDVPASICPEDPAKFINKTEGAVDLWHWSFGNGSSSNLHTPSSFHYPITGTETYYTIKLVASNNAMNCRDSLSKRIQVLGNCYIAVPTAFTPNGDGRNDYLFPNNALKADNLLFRVYNRMGQIVFETKDWTKKWNGAIGGVMQSTGVYAWILTYVHHDTGEKVFQKGTTVLIR